MKEGDVFMKKILTKATVAATVLAAFFSATAAFGATQFDIRYGKAENGKFVNAYAKWNRKAVAGQKITTPKVSDRTDGTRCWWRANNRTGSDEIRSGGTYTVKGNTNFYAVWRKLYSVRFMNQAGTSENKNLRLTLCSGETYKTPSMTPPTGYSFAGWSASKNSSSAQYKAGQTVKMTGNRILYAVFVKKTVPATVTLKRPNGATYAVISPDGRKTFPSVGLSGRKTLQGWDESNGKTKNPKYLEGDVIPKKSAVYYMVLNDADADKGNVSIKESMKYVCSYFVGDSRMQYSQAQFGSTLRKTKFIALGGMGYNWLSKEASDGGYRRLISTLKTDVKKTKGKRAVIFCLGVNDLQNIDSYVKFYKSKATELKNLGCDLFVMSVNPFCAMQRQLEMRTYYSSKHPNYTERRTKSLRDAFNAKLKGLSGTYKYIDSFSYLVKTGWPTLNASIGFADGLHYTKATNQRIINYALSVTG